MADQTPPEPVFAIPFSLLQRTADYIRSNPSTQAVDVPMQLLAGLQSLKAIPGTVPTPAKPLGQPTKPTTAKKKATRKARRR